MKKIESDRLQFLITALKSAPMKLRITSSENERIMTVILTRLDRLEEELKQEIKPTNDNNKKIIKQLMLGFLKMRNRAESIVDLIRNDDLTEAELKEYTSWQVRCANIVSSLISSVDGDGNSEDNMQKLEVRSSSDSDDKQDEAENALDRMLSNAERTIMHYAVYSDRMPTDARKVTKPFVVNNFPIIPILRGGVSAKDFNTFGISTKEIEFYIVLEKQLCVGINSYVDSGITIDGIIEALGERFSKDWSVLGKPRRDSRGYMWYWLFPTSILDKLAHEGKPLKVSSWGFAFKRD